MPGKQMTRVLIMLTLTMALGAMLTASLTRAITPAEVKTHAQAWVDQHVRYCGLGVSCVPGAPQYVDGYRPDSPGFVSYAWNLRDNAGNPQSLVTSALPNVASHISKDQLQTGDILLNVCCHTLLFDQWANDQHTEYWAYEMIAPTAVYRKVPYPYWSGYGAYEPYRYNSMNSNRERTILYGQTLNGNINPPHARDTYNFNGTAGDTVTVRMSKTSVGLDAYLELWKGGRLIRQDDDSGGDYDAMIVQTLPETGSYRIVAHSWGGHSSGSYTLQLTQESPRDPDDMRWVAHGQSLPGNVSPTNDSDTYYFGGVAGRVVAIRMNKVDAGLDSFLELWGPGGRVAHNDDGGGNNDSWLVATLPSSGIYRLAAHSWNFQSGGQYILNVDRVISSNLAVGKNVVASSVEFPGVEPAQATDGNMGTRWSSRFVDPGWIYVDLGTDTTIDQVVLKWGPAYGHEFGIYTMSNAQCCSSWNYAYYTSNGSGGTNTLNFPARTARWVLMYGVRRGAPWGYSLWEFEVYNTAYTVIPIVPPEDPDKGIPTFGPEPLPIDPSKELEPLSVGSGEDGQEYLPLPSDPPATQPPVNPTTTFVPPTASIDVISPTVNFAGGPVIYFSGSGIDGNPGGSVVAYGWSSSLDGPIGVGYSPSFWWSPNQLSLGTHVIALSTQNYAGSWSLPVTQTLTINAGYGVFLPLVAK